MTAKKKSEKNKNFKTFRGEGGKDLYWVAMVLIYTNVITTLEIVGGNISVPGCKHEVGQD